MSCQESRRTFAHNGKRRRQIPKPPPISEELRMHNFAHLPPELLSQVFSHLPLRPPPFWCGVYSPYPITWSIAIVCRAWCGPATEFLYRSLSIKKIGSAQLLLRTLKVQPQLRRLVKALGLPSHGTVRCPPPVIKVFIQIINTLEALDTLYCPIAFLNYDTWADWNGTHQILPIAPGNHLSLTSLSVIGDMNYRNGFHSQILRFQNVRSLELGGFPLTTPLDPRIHPPLPLLEAITLSYDDENLAKMDEWLIACPRLQEIELFLISAPYPIPRILSCGKIKHLGAFWASGSGFYEFFPAYSGLKSLELAASIFNKHRNTIPSALDELWIRTGHWEELQPSALEQFVQRQPKIREIFLRLSGSNNTKPERIKELVSICKQNDIQASIELHERGE